MNNRLGKLEERLSDLRIALDGGDYGVRPDRDDRRRLEGKIKAVGAEVERQTARLRALVAGGEKP